MSLHGIIFIAPMNSVPNIQLIPVDESGHFNRSGTSFAGVAMLLDRITWS
jgi:hypothetical protein